MIKFDRNVIDCTQGLPPKWDALFKQIIKQYDLKQYEKALKSAEEMLKVYPAHAESMAIKGIILTNVDKAFWKDDAPLSLLKEAVRLHIKSPFCWHMLGRLYIQEKNYLETMKCYRMVVKLDPTNIVVMLDLAKLETHLGDFPNLVKTRKALLSVRPGDSFSWISLAVAHDLNGEHDIALQVFDESVNITDRELLHTEHHERALYHVRLLMKTKKYRRILDMLPILQEVIQNEPRLRHIQAECLLQLGLKAESADLYHKILSKNPDLAALKGYVSARVSFSFDGKFEDESLSRNEKDEIFAVLVTLDDFPIAVQIALQIANEDEFSQMLPGFLEKYISMNITVALNVLKPFYCNHQRIESIESCLILWVKKEEALNASDRKMNPMQLFCLYVMLAQHYIRTSKLSKASIYLEKAKMHTPTAEILTLIEARIEKKRKNKENLLQALKRGTEIGLKDRYVSNRYVKHLLRCHKVEDAEKVFREFNDIKESNFFKHLNDIQCIWYEIELADSLYDQEDVLSALQIYLMVYKHINEFIQDVYDFHGYCLQRGTLCAYIDVIESSTNHKKHHWCLHASAAIVRCLIDISDAKNIADLQIKRTPYGKTIAENAYTVQLPNLENGIISAFEYVCLLEKHNEQDPKSLALCGIVYFKLNKHDSARKMLDKAIEFSKKELVSDVDALYNLLEGRSNASIEETTGLISKLQLA